MARRSHGSGLSWITYAPDGCEVQVRWHAGEWRARTSHGEEVASSELATALSGVLRLGPAVAPRNNRPEIATWVAGLAKQLEYELRLEQERRLQ